MDTSRGVDFDGFGLWFGAGVFNCSIGGRFGRRVTGVGVGCWFRGEVAGGDLEDVGEESCSLEVHAIGGEECGEISEGLLDDGAGEVGGNFEGLVLVDRRDDFVTVGEAHVVVVHGDGAAAATVRLVVHALVGDGGLALEVVVAGWHGLAPPGGVVPGLVDGAWVSGGES